MPYAFSKWGPALLAFPSAVLPKCSASHLPNKLLQKCNGI